MDKPKTPSPNGRRFEYTVRRISLKDWEMIDLDSTLTKFGDGGWELCTRNKASFGDGEMWELIFKRERK